MRQVKSLCCAALLLASVAFAQPVVNSVLNPASYALPGTPNYGIAQGALFVVFGTGLGPPGLNQVGSFPLPKVLNNISIKVTVAGTTVDCIIMNSYSAGSTPATQVVGLLPSSTPVGTGTLILTYNGQASAAASITVVARAFGIIAVNSGGSGPAVVTDANYSVRLITQSATNRQVLILWGIGLGATTGDETQPPTPRDMTELDVKLFVGGQQARVLYRGRSGGAGLDQINFEVPDGVQGCYVPIFVTVNGVASNFGTIPIAGDNGPCSDPNGLSAAELDAARGRGELKIGVINLSRGAVNMSIPGFGDVATTTDTGSAYFARYDFGRMIMAQSAAGSSYLGSCVVYQYAGTQAGGDPVTPDPLDAGAALTLTGPKGVKQIPKTQGSLGSYSAQLGGGGVMGVGGLPDYLDAAGDYTVTNGSGGANVGSISNAKLTLSQPLVWSNQASITNVQRSQNLQLSWTGGPANGVVMAMGISSITTPMQVTTAFMCTAPVSAGQMTVPSAVLSALPASGTSSGVPMGMLTLSGSTPNVRFSAPGLDIGSYMVTYSTTKTVAFQ